MTPRAHRRNENGRSVLRRMASVLGIALVLVVLVANIHAWRLRRTQARTLAALREEIATLEARERSATLFFADVTSPHVIEREARAQLGYQRPDEHVVIFPADGIRDGSDANSDDRKSPTYAREWMSYFFRH